MSEATESLTHHPDCLFWFENYAFECTCGLTAPTYGRMRPWSVAALREWRKAVMEGRQMGLTVALNDSSSPPAQGGTEASEVLSAPFMPPETSNPLTPSLMPATEASDHPVPEADTVTLPRSEYTAILDELEEARDLLAVAEGLLTKRKQA